MQNSYFFEGALCDAADVLDVVNFQEAVLEDQQVGMRGSEGQLRRRGLKGDVDVFGLAMEGLDFEGVFGGEGQQFFIYGEGS